MPTRTGYFSLQQDHVPSIIGLPVDSNGLRRQRGKVVQTFLSHWNSVMIFFFIFVTFFHPCSLWENIHTEKHTHLQYKHFSSDRKQHCFYFPSGAFSHSLLAIIFLCTFKRRNLHRKELPQFHKEQSKFSALYGFENGFINWRCRPLLVKSHLSFCRVFFLKQHKISEWMRIFIEWWLLPVLAWRYICSFLPRVKYGSGCLHLLSCLALFSVTFFLIIFQNTWGFIRNSKCVGSVRRFQLRSLMVYYLCLSQDASTDFCFMCHFLLHEIYLVLQNTRKAHGYYTTGLAWIWFKVSK